MNIRSRFTLFPAAVAVLMAVLLLGAASAATAVKKDNHERQAPIISGTVVETMNSGGYSYIRIERHHKHIWVAVPQMKVVVGKTMEFRVMTFMRDFRSSTLHRTFSKIIFAAGPLGQQNQQKVERGGKLGKPASPAAMEGPPPALRTSMLTGTVVETMNSGGYTYVRLKHTGGRTWVAMPQMKVHVGQKLTLSVGPELHNFRSTTLKRTFDTIVFSGGPSAKGIAASRAPGSRAAVAAAQKISVAKATGPNAYRVAEIFAKRAALNGKTVVVRGKVVKFARAIMGRNWVHIQDGTGDPAKGTRDLVVTTQGTAAVGDVVIVKGTLAADKDFGAGYKYPAIIEDAALAK